MPKTPKEKKLTKKQQLALDLSEQEKARQALEDEYAAIESERAQLARLQALDLFCCKALQSLPESLGQLAQLQTLNLWCCTALQSLPDLSALVKPAGQLEVQDLPYACAGWKRGGYKAWRRA